MIEIFIKSSRFTLICLCLIPVYIFSSCTSGTDITIKGPPKSDIAFFRTDEFVKYGYRYIGQQYPSMTEEEKTGRLSTELVEVRGTAEYVLYTYKGYVTFLFAETGEKSGDYLYFLSTEDSQTYELYSYDTRSGFFSKMIPGPLSTLVVPHENSKYGYILSKNEIMTIDLSHGSIDNEKTVKFTNTESLFLFDANNHVYSELAAADEKVLDIKVIVYKNGSGSGQPDNVQYFTYNTDSMEIFDNNF